MSSLVRVPFLLVLSAGLAAQAAAPPVLRLEVRPTLVRAMIAHPGEFFGVLVVSRNSSTFVNEHGFEILEQWDAVASGSAVDELRLAFPIDVNVLVDLDAHLQAVVWVGGRQQTVSSPISIRRWLADNPLLPELTVDVFWTADRKLRLRAVYTAPTDGYDLALAAVSTSKEGIRVELKLKTPGPGEGMRDVVETHVVEIDLVAKPGQTVLVFVGETNGIDPIKFFALTRRLVVPPRDVAQPPNDAVQPASDVATPPSDLVPPSPVVSSNDDAVLRRE